MANEFIIRKGYKSLASSEVTGSLLITGSATIDAGDGNNPLTIQGSSHKYVDITTTTNNQVGIRMTDDSVTYIMGLHGGEDAFKISKNSSFGTNDYFNIDANGKVGIGTVTPSQLLSVEGDVSASAYYGDGSNLTGVLTSTPTLDQVTDQGATTTNAISTGTITANGSILGGGNLFLRSYNTDPKGIFFRDGFEYGDTNQYNLSITVFDDGDSSADAMNINAYDGIYFNVQSGTTPSTAFKVLNSEIRAYANLITTGDLIVSGSHITANVGTGGTPQSTDYLYIGGDNLASADGAIYIGNRGDGTGYGYRIYYSGVGSGNNNKLILKSENLGSTVDMLTFTADGAATFANDVVVAGTLTAQEFHTEYVSASIVHQSGSTKFGDTSDDNHDFTGSINLTGSMEIQQTVDGSGLVIRSSNVKPEIRFIDDSGTSQVFGIGYNRGGNHLVIDFGNASRVEIAEGGQMTLNTINQAASDTDKFLVSDSGAIKFRSGSQVLSDIGAAASSHTHAATDITSGTLNNARLDAKVFVNDGGTFSDGFASDVDDVVGFRTLRVTGFTGTDHRAFTDHHNMITIPNTSSTQYDAQLAFQTGTVSQGGLKYRSSTNGTWSDWYKIWHEGNDGPTSGLSAQTAGTASYVLGSNVNGTVASATSASHAGSAPYSGLYGTVPTWNQDTTGTAATASYVAASNINGSVNADTLDSINSTQFLRSDAADTASGRITFTNSDSFRTIELQSTTPAVYFKDTDATQGYHVGQNGDRLWILRDSDGNGAYNNILAHWDTGGYKAYTNVKIDGGLEVSGSTTIISGSNTTVGIATSTAYDTLHVNGTLRVGPYFSTNDRDHIKFIPHGTDTKIISPNERFHIENLAGDLIMSASGGVGIGTLTPGAKLHVQGGISGSGAIETDYALVVKAVDGAGNVNPATDEVRLSGYGLIGDRANLYFTNANTSGVIQVGIGGVHANNTVAHFDSAGLDVFGAVSASSFTGDGSGLSNITVTSASYAATSSHYTGVDLSIGGDNTTPLFDMLFDDHASGGTWDTRIQIGKSDDFVAQGVAPTYIATGAYGMQIQANSDGVFYGMEEYTTGHYRPIIQWGDDDTDSPFRIKHETGSELEISYAGDVTTTGDLIVNGGNITVNNNNGGVSFNDSTNYWLRTATNWGIYWDTSNNQLQFHGAGNNRAFIDLDSGRISGNEHGIFAGNVYASGTEGFVFGSSTSEGEYIKRVGNDIQFVAGGGFKMFIDGDDTRVGIGTSSTSAVLQLYKAHGTAEFVTLSNSTSAGRIQIGFQQNDTDGMHHRALITSEKDSNGTYGGRLDFKVREHSTSNYETALTLRSDQSVGIGTTDPTARLTVEGSGSTVFDVQGSQGQLFSITDDLTGDLFSVSDISGIPILNVNASGDSYFDGNLDISGSLNVTGSAFFNGSIGNTPAANPGVHIGISDGNDGQIQIIGSSAHIDFSNAGSEDYDARIILEGNDELNVAGVGNNFQVNGNRVLTTADEGSGNGIDADTVDNVHATSFLRSDVDDTVNAYTTQIRFPSNNQLESTGGSNASLEVYNSNAGEDAFMAFHVSGDYAVYFGLDGSTNDLAVGGWSKGATKQRIFHDGYHPNADTWTTGRTLTIGNTGKTVNGSGNVSWTLGEIGATPFDHFRSLGVTAFTTGTTTTAGIIAEMEGDGAFDSYTSAFKTSWSYAGNIDITDGGTYGPSETAGMSFLTWTDNSNDTTRGNITFLAIAPNTGGSAGRTFIYNDQGSGYDPGWREIWTSRRMGAGTNLDADKLDGQEGSFYQNASNLNAGTFPDLFSNSTRYNIGFIDGSSSQSRDKLRVWSDGTYSMGMKNGYDFGYLGSGEYAMSFQMSNTAGRGFWWGDSAHSDDQGAMSLTTDGRLMVATRLSVGNGESATSPNNTATLSIENGGSSGNIRWNNSYSAFNLGLYYGLPYIASESSGNTIIGLQVGNPVSGQNNFYVIRGSAGIGVTPSTTIGRLDCSNDIVAYSSSDRRWKENIKTIENPIDKVKAIGGYEFDWKELTDEETTTQHSNKGHDIGVIAQEIEEVLPEVVTTRENGYKGVRYEKITPLLIEAIKEQQKQIDQLQAIVSKLQNEK